MSSLPVLVLGSGVTALGAVRTLASVGIPASVLADDPGFVARSRWFRAAPGRAAAADADLAGYLASTAWPKAVLLPCSDHWAQRVAELPAEVRQRFPSSVPRADTLATFIDKGRFAALLETVEVRIQLLC